MKEIFPSVYYLGGQTKAKTLFENQFEIPNGMSYNSYLFKDDINILFDTVDSSISSDFISRLKEALNGDTLDYLVVQHVEPDHSYQIGEVLKAYPCCKIVCSQLAKKMISAYFEVKEKNYLIVEEGQSLKSAHFNFKFISAPLVHWPEVLFAYEENNQYLLSADAFGTFGSFSSIFFNEQIDNEAFYSEARRYYTNIVGKFGCNVLNVLKKASALSIKAILPLHGPIFVNNYQKLIDLYSKWASYTPEIFSEVAIFYGSMYSNTEKACLRLKEILEDKGIKTSAYDVSKVEVSYLVSEAFRVNNIVIASPTYNSNVFPGIESLILHLNNAKLTKRTYAFIESGTWAPCATSILHRLIPSSNNTILQTGYTLLGGYSKEKCEDGLTKLADAIIASFPVK